MSRIAGLLVCLLLGSSAALAQSEKDWKICNSDEDTKDDNKAAIAACTRLIGTGKLTRKNFMVAYYNRGLSHRRLGENDKALADYNKALEYDPNDSDIYNNRGIVYEAKDDLARAFADYNKAIQLNGKSSDAYSNRGDIYRKRLDYDKAIADYQKAVSLDTNKAIYHDDLAEAYAMTGQYDRAIASSTRAIGLNDKRSNSHFSRGVSHFFKGDLAKAASDMRRAADLGASGSAMIYRYLARARGGDKATSELEADVTRLKTQEWPFAGIEMLLGKRAPDAVLAAADGPSQKCDAHFYISQWHLLRGDRAQAQASLRIAADVCPRSDYEHMGARAELARLGG